MTFTQVFTWFYDQYGVAMEEKIIKNIAKLLKSWSPHEEMENLINNFDKGLTYTSFASQEIANHTIVTYFLTVIKKTGKYQCACQTLGGTTKKRKLSSWYVVVVDWAHSMRCLKTRNNSIGEISPSIAGTASGKPANMASLEIVWCEFVVDIILVKIRLELVVFV